MANRGEYEVVIPVRMRNETASGSDSVASSAEALAEQVLTSRERAEEQYQSSLQRFSEQNQRLFEQEAQARADAAFKAEKAAEDSFEREMRARADSYQQQGRDADDLAQRLSRLAADRAAEDERFAWQTVESARRAREKEAEDASRYAQQALESRLKAEQEYQDALQRQSAQNQSQWEREARAQSDAAWKAEKESEDAFEKEMRARAAAYQQEGKDAETLANKLAKIAADRAAEDEKFARKTADDAQRIRDREAAGRERDLKREQDARQRQAQQMTRDAERAAQDSALAFNNIFGASLFAGLVQSAVQGFFSMIKDGIVDTTLYAARTEELGIALDAVSKAQHLNIASTRETVQSLEQANIATQAAEQALARFVAVGLPLEKASPLAAVAKDLAVIAGANSSDEFNDLVQGITTLQTRVLRTAGAFINIKQVEEDYAKSVGRTTASLSTEEKQLAVLNAVIAYGAGVTGTYDAAMSSASKQMRSLTRVQQDFSDAIGEKFLPVLGAGVKLVTLFFKVGIDGASGYMTAAIGIGVFTAALIAMNTAQIASLPVLSQVISSVSLLGKVMMANAGLAAGSAATMVAATAGWAAVALVVIGVAYAIGNYIDAQHRATEATKEHIDKLTTQRDALQSQEARLKTVADSSADVSTQQKILTESYNTLTPAQQAHIDKMKEEHADNQQLAKEIEHIIELKRQQAEVELRASSNTNVSIFAGKLQEIKTQKDTIDSLNRDLERYQALIRQVESGGPLSAGEASRAGVTGRIAGGSTAFELGSVQLSDLTNKSTEASNAIDNLSKSKAKLSDEAVNLYNKQEVLNKTLGVTTDQALDQSNKVGTLGIGLDVAKKFAADFSAQMRAMATDTAAATSSLDQQIDAIDKLASAARQSERSKVLKGQLQTIAEDAPDSKAAKQRFNEMMQNSPKFKAMVEDEQRVQKTQNDLEEYVGLKRAKRTAQHKSELETLSDRYRKLAGDVQSFTDLSSKEFVLRFKTEELERVKRSYEDILNMRRSMGLELSAPLPEVITNPKSGQQRQQQNEQIRTLNATVESYQSLKRVFDPIREAMKEELHTEEQLAVLRATQNLPVVGASIRAEQLYAKSIRDTRNELQQLGAEIIANGRLMALDAEDTERREAKAYLQITKNFQEREKAADEELARQQALQEALNNPERLQGIVEHQLNLTPPQTPTELAQIAAHAATLNDNVARIALKITGGSSAPAGVAILNTATEQVKSKTAAVRQQIAEEQAKLGQGTADGGDEVLKIDKAGMKDLLTQETVLRVTRKEAEVARVASTTNAQLEIWANEAKLGHQLIDIEKDVSLERSRQNLQREKDVRRTTINIQLMNEDIAALDTGDPEARLRQHLRVDEERGRSRLTLRDEIAKTESDIAHFGEDSALREKKAWLDAIHAIQEADASARDSIITSQVKMADATIYHAYQANAKVLEFLASQKSVTDIIADAKIGVIKSTFDLMGSGLDHMLSKLGKMGGLVKEVIMGFATLALSKFFQFIAGVGPNGTSQSSGGGGAGGALRASLGNFLRPGGATGGGGSSVAGSTSTGSGSFGQILSGGFGGLAPMGGGANAFAAPSMLSMLTGGMDMGGGIGVPTSMTDAAATQGIFSSILHESGHAGGAAATGAAASGGLSLSGMGASLGPMLPLLGAGLGAQLGGPSMTGSILGGAGGLLAGTLGLAVLNPAVLGGALAGMGSFGVGAAAFLTSTLGFATLGIGAAALIIGSLLLSKNAQRRKDETFRNQLSTETLPQVYDLLAQAQAGDLTVSQARARWDQIHNAYLQQANTIKDKKTRNHAILWWDNDVTPIWSKIETAAREGEKAKAFQDKFVPTYADGGTVSAGSSMMPGMSSYSRLPDFYTGRVPGAYDRRDDKLVRVSGDEVVLTPQQWKPIIPYLKSVQVPGFANSGGVWAPGSPTAAASPVNAGLAPIVIRRMSVRFDGLKELVHVEMQSEDGRDIIVGQVETHIEKTGSDGLLGTIELGING